MGDLNLSTAYRNRDNHIALESTTRQTDLHFPMRGRSDTRNWHISAIKNLVEGVPGSTIFLFIALAESLKAMTDSAPLRVLPLQQFEVFELQQPRRNGHFILVKQPDQASGRGGVNIRQEQVGHSTVELQQSVGK
jgi:hypothetical protein